MFKDEETRWWCGNNFSNNTWKAVWCQIIERDWCHKNIRLLFHDGTWRVRRDLCLYHLPAQQHQKHSTRHGHVLSYCHGFTKKRMQDQILLKSLQKPFLWKLEPVWRISLWCFLINKSHKRLWCEWLASNTETSVRDTTLVTLSVEVAASFIIFCLFCLYLHSMYLHSFLLCTATAAQQFLSGSYLIITHAMLSVFDLKLNS